MIYEISSGLSGFNAAVTRLDVSANNIANQTSGTPASPPAIVAPMIDVAQQLFDASMASYVAQANLLSMNARAEIDQQALNIIT